MAEVNQTYKFFSIFQLGLILKVKKFKIDYSPNIEGKIILD